MHLLRWIAFYLLLLFKFSQSSEIANMPLSIRQFVACASGGSAIEYSLIASLIFLAIIASLYTYQTRLGALFSAVGSAVAAATN
jgi:Flp pilus assembly pilin Flp